MLGPPQQARSLHISGVDWVRLATVQHVNAPVHVCDSVLIDVFTGADKGYASASWDRFYDAGTATTGVRVLTSVPSHLCVSGQRHC